MAHYWPEFVPTGEVVGLGGGVSNVVLKIPTAQGPIVLKQALEKLRVKEDWRSDPRRTVRECEAMQALQPLLPEGALPKICFLDRERSVYAMAAAPDEARDWKTWLLSGQVEPAVGGQIGTMLAAQIAGTWHDPAFADQFGDQRVFDELRLDPYYRVAAARNPELAPQVLRLVEHCQTYRHSVVHGDWSPKNFLVRPARPAAPLSVMAIDYEVVHFGDPAFDAAFLLNHLLLKSIHMPPQAAALRSAAEAFVAALAAGLPEQAAASGFWGRTRDHLGGLLLARVDGKSPAEYLAPWRFGLVRRLARHCLLQPGDPLEAFAALPRLAESPKQEEDASQG